MSKLLKGLLALTGAVAAGVAVLKLRERMEHDQQMEPLGEPCIPGWPSKDPFCLPKVVIRS